MPNGTLLRQVNGIPVGDPISPGMTIGTLAWMEKEWMKQLHPTDKQYFKGARYMDHVLIVYVQKTLRGIVNGSAMILPNQQWLSSTA